MSSKGGTVKEVQNLNDLFIYAAEVTRKEVTYEPISITGENFAISLHIEGPTWDKRVDPRIAKYVLLLQNSFDDLLAEYSDSATYEETPPMVKMEARDGSSLPWTEISKFLKHVLTPMTPEKTFIAVLVAIGAISGAYYVHRFCQWRETVRDSEKNEYLGEMRLREMEAREKTLQVAIDALAARAQAEPEKFTSYERPVRHIVRTLEERDTLQIGHSQPIPADIVKQLNPKRLPRSEEQLTYGDGAYILKKRNYEEGELVLELSQGDIDIKAYLWQLDEADAKNFVDALNDREQQENLPLTLDLQINLIHTARRLKYGVILGMGDPRKGKVCKTLETLVAGFKK